jgi:hypothetical protein
MAKLHPERWKCEALYNGYRAAAVTSWGCHATARHMRHELEWLVEHDWTDWPRFPWLVETADGTWSLPPGTPRLPLSFSLLASRAPATSEND